VAKLVGFQLDNAALGYSAALTILEPVDLEPTWSRPGDGIIRAARYARRMIHRAPQLGTTLANVLHAASIKLRGTPDD